MVEDEVAQTIVVCRLRLPRTDRPQKTMACPTFMDRLAGSLRCGRRLAAEGRGRGMHGFSDVDCTIREPPQVAGNPQLVGCNDLVGFRTVLSRGLWVESLARTFAVL